MKAALIGDAPLAENRERKIREADVEEYLVKRVAAMGGVAEKFSSPNRASVPDRLVLWPPKPAVSASRPASQAVVHFIECKAPGKEPTAAQERDHVRRRQMGFIVEVVDSFRAVEDYLENFRP